MPLGDSITEGSCTSQLLFDKLRKAGRTDVDMIGTRANQGDCGVSEPDRDNEGHSGYYATELVGEGKHAAELVQWCKADRADVVLMHLGTNDIWHANLEPQLILEAFTAVLAELRAVQPNVIVFVAEIIPMQPGDCSDCGARVPVFNSQVADWARAHASPDSPIYVVDQWSGFDAAADTADGVHPNLQGARKMADRWFSALEAQLPPMSR